MSHAFQCNRCGKAYPVPDRLVGRKARCPACGHVRSIPSPIVESSPGPVRPTEPREYALLEVPSEPAIAHAITPTHAADERHRVPSTRGSRPIRWRRFLLASIRESSLLEQEISLLIALSAADLLVTYALLRRGPSFYESNPVAQWFFARWNIAGMTGLKFGVVGAVIVIGELVEHHRPRWGRALLGASCLATAAVVWHGLRLLFGYAHDGAPQF